MTESKHIEHSRQIIISKDGSTSLYSKYFKDSYHSKFGALNESRHIFIDHGLKAVCQTKDIHILEIGFGTGLNALLTVLSDHPHEIRYTALEPYPLNQNEIDQLNFAQVISRENAKEYLDILHGLKWDGFFPVGHKFQICKIKSSLQQFNSDQKYDLIYFDAFSPQAQPELWTKDIFAKIAGMSNPQAILVTYCSKGEVRRHLKEVGFEVTKLEGPFGKREITQARYKS